MKSAARLLLFLNFCMYAIVLGIAAWTTNTAINNGFIIDGPELRVPAIAFPMGNDATGFFVVFSLIAGVAGVASTISGLNNLRYWDSHILSAAASSVATISWTLTLLAMGFGCKEFFVIDFSLTTMEAFVTILSFTQLFYIVAIHRI